MKVPFLDIKAQYDSIRDEINPAIQNILDNTSFILGNAVKEFESNFAKAHNVKNCVGVSSGTDGNHLVLWALGIKPEDEVIIPVNTFIATAWGATLCGATPVFVDCESDSYNLDPEKIEKAITKNTKAIVAVHLYGQPADMDRIKEIADKYNLILVEDCAQSHLAEYKNQKTGGLAKAASFSFYPGKNLGAYGEGGAVTTNDDELALKFRMMREHGSSKKYYHELYGHNYRLEGIQGAVLNVKLKHLEKWTNERRRAAKKYYECLKGIEQIIVPKEMEYSRHVYHLFVIQVKSMGKKDGTSKRDDLQKYLEENGISTGLHYPVPLHVQPCFSHLGYKKGDFLVAESLAENCLSLPMYPELKDEQIEYIADKIKEFLD